MASGLAFPFQLIRTKLTLSHERQCFVLGREYPKIVQTLDVPKYKAITLLFMYVVCLLFYAIGGGC